MSYNSARAKKDAADRQRLVDRLMKKVKDGKVKIKDIIPNYGTKKYLQISHGEATVNEAKIDEDAKWDGLYGVISNVKSKAPEELLQTYHGLWQIEEAFRVNKHDLKMRPIYHWTEKRIKAHISLCFLAFTLVKQATYRLSIQQTPMSFEQLRNELLHTQSSILVDLETKNKYRLPSKVTINQKNIYQAFGLKRTGVIRKII
ncbi:transposase [bacterium]|nr:transposase [bacterium]